MKDLRTYLVLIAHNAPDQLCVVDDRISWEYDVASYVTEMERIKINPALLFRNIKATIFPSL